MTASAFIVVTSKGIDRMVKGEGYQLKPNERAFRLEIEIPDEAFKNPPVPTVRMSVPAEALTRVFSADVLTPEEVS